MLLLVLELLDPAAAVCEVAVEVAVDLPEAAVFVEDDAEPVDVVIAVDEAVVAAAARPAVIVTICPPSSDPPFENDVVVAEDVAEEATFPRTVPLQVPLSELVISHPKSITSLSPSPSSKRVIW